MGGCCWWEGQAAGGSLIINVGSSWPWDPQQVSRLEDASLCWEGIRRKGGEAIGSNTDTAAVHGHGALWLLMHLRS